MIKKKNKNKKLTEKEAIELAISFKKYEAELQINHFIVLLYINVCLKKLYFCHLINTLDYLSK